MSASITARPKAVTMNVRERTRGWLNPLNLHWAGVAVLGVLNLYLLVHMAVAWQTAKNQDADALARQQVALKTAQIQEKPLEGLDVKLQSSKENADLFYRERLPVSYSQVASELGVLAKRESIRLTRVQYAQSAVEGDAAGQLTQVTMDASLSGDYRKLVLFMNGLERDRVFFLISGVSLTGQQTGTVNLRVRLTTYLRGLPATDDMQRVAIGGDSSVPSPAGGTR